MRETMQVVCENCEYAKIQVDENDRLQLERPLYCVIQRKEIKNDGYCEDFEFDENLMAEIDGAFE